MNDHTQHDIERILKNQADALERLCEEADRIRREIHEHLHRLRPAGDRDTASERAYPTRTRKPKRRE